MNEPTVTLQIKMPRGTYARLVAEANASNISLSELLARILGEQHDDER